MSDGDFSVSGIGSDLNLPFVNHDLEELIYGALKPNNKINVLQLVLSALIFLSVIAIIQSVFIEIQGFDSLNFNPLSSQPVSTDLLARRRSTQFKFTIALIGITILVYVIYRMTNK